MNVVMFLKKAHIHLKRSWVAREAEKREKGRMFWPRLS